jgi:Zn-dependent peptidase ImmA (M78 family)
MSRVAINEKVIRWALDRSHLTESAMQQKLPYIKEWVAGTRLPTLRQLEVLAKVTRTPLGVLFLSEPPEESLPIPHFRTIGDEAASKPSPELLDTIRAMQRRQAWMREFLIDQGQDRLAFVGSAQIKEDVRSVTERMRRILGFNEEWASAYKTWVNAFRALREAMEDAGILVASNGVVGNNTYRKLNPAEFRGFVLSDDYAPLVFVNGADGQAAQMFTLAHELAHVFFGSSVAFDLHSMQPAEDPAEKACNRIAAEFLVPERKLRQIWPSTQKDMELFQIIARQFKVSTLVIARRALDLALISKEEFIIFYRQVQERYSSSTRSEGGNFYVNQNYRIGRRFATAVARAAMEGKLLYDEAYELTGLYGKAFHSYAQYLEIGA